MAKNPPPAYSQPPPTAPPTYAQAVGGVSPTSPFVPNYTFSKQEPRIITTVIPVGPHSTHTICPHCHHEINTTIKSTPAPMAYFSGILLFIMGCALGCCLIPCCLERCRNVYHSCPNCGSHIGEFRR